MELRQIVCNTQYRSRDLARFIVQLFMTAYLYFPAVKETNSFSWPEVSQCIAVEKGKTPHDSRSDLEPSEESCSKYESITFGDASDWFGASAFLGGYRRFFEKLYFLRIPRLHFSGQHSKFVCAFHFPRTVFIPPILCLRTAIPSLNANAKHFNAKTQR